MERGIITTSSKDDSIDNNTEEYHYHSVMALFAAVDKIRYYYYYSYIYLIYIFHRYFKDSIKSKSRIHITCGHSTVMANVIFMKKEEEDNTSSTSTSTMRVRDSKSSSNTMMAYDDEATLNTTIGGGALLGNDEYMAMSTSNTGDYVYQDELLFISQEDHHHHNHHDNDDGYGDNLNDSSTEQYYALIELERPILACKGSVFIASRLDKEYNTSSVCRLAFYGVVSKTYKVLHGSGSGREDLSIIKWKYREGIIDRYVPSSSSTTTCNTYIVRNMFKKDTDLTSFLGLKVIHKSSGITGIIDSSFGKSGKIKCIFNTILPNADNNVLSNRDDVESVVLLRFKKRLFHNNNKSSKTPLIQ